MIIITGAAGFIGSCLTGNFNRNQIDDLVLVDDFSSDLKQPNLVGKEFIEQVERENFWEWFNDKKPDVEMIFHLGARTDTTLTDSKIFDQLNVDFSKKIWTLCSKHDIPLVYASSAATYGNGEHGYEDDHEGISKLKPLNAYGISKQEFDVWALQQKEAPPNWIGLKFFNVYGPNEYHKGRMAFVYQAYQQIVNERKITLFKSHHPDFKDGEQQRDFIYVMDIVDVCFYLLEHAMPNGIYNLGTGKAETFLTLAESIFESMSLQPNIEFIDTPEDIRENYQYFTEASMNKFKEAGYSMQFSSLMGGIYDYVQEYLDNVRPKYY